MISLTWIVLMQSLSNLEEISYTEDPIIMTFHVIEKAGTSLMTLVNLGRSEEWIN